ncbi:MAG TPA: hypothetical protein VHE57_02845 [Mycobacteriales bacterium]|nr:hypothetical protein [Mycobacteriales bacterium]
MSDTSILPTAADAGAPPAGPGPDFGDEPTDDRRRLLIIGGAIAAVLIVLVGYLVLRGGGSSSDDTLGAVPRGTPSTATSPASGEGTGGSGGGSKAAGAAGGAKAGDALPKKSTRRLAKDPFKPLVVDSESKGATGSATAVGGTSGTSGTSTAPGTVPTSPAAGGAPDAAVGAPLAIRLVDVLGHTVAVFDVTYAHHKVFRFQVQAPPSTSKKGTVFAQDFALLGIQGKEATVQVGDDTPFDMKKGSTHPV